MQEIVLWGSEMGEILGFQRPKDLHAYKQSFAALPLSRWTYKLDLNNKNVPT